MPLIIKTRKGLREMFYFAISGAPTVYFMIQPDGSIDSTPRNHLGHPIKK